MSDDEKAKLGYQAAIQMIAYEGQVIWRAFSAMVTANSLIVATGAFLAHLRPGIPALKLLPILGWILCLCWLLVVARQFGYYRYWFACAKGLEKDHLSPTVLTISAGGEYSKGNTVKLGATEEVRMGWFGRLFKVQWLMYAAIAVFVFLYYLLLGL